MTKTDFIIECSMRLYCNNKEFLQEGCIEMARQLANELEKRGYLKK